MCDSPLPTYIQSQWISKMNSFICGLFFSEKKNLWTFFDVGYAFSDKIFVAKAD